MTTLTPSLRENKEEALAFFREHGFLIERNTVDGAWRESLIEMAMEQPSAQDGTYNPISMPHLVDEKFLQTMRLPQIVSVVETLVGGVASGIGGEFFFMRPGTPGFTHHQDNAYIQAPPDEFVSAWTALSDVDKSNGGLTFYPRSHKFGLLPIHKNNEGPYEGQNPDARSVQCELPPNCEALDIEIEAGSTAFFHSLLVHHSNPNITTDRFRYVYLATYIHQGRPFRAGATQRRTEIELHN
jgi:ectoine hydroxylase-related dioxygenase (phytanoyl-CoA dioxygenase family)